jgi:hypothetical protein
LVLIALCSGNLHYPGERINETSTLDWAISAKREHGNNGLKLLYLLNSLSLHRAHFSFNNTPERA